MCGIAGRIAGSDARAGADLVELMQAQRHRGGDSTGFGIYGPRLERGYVVRMVANDRRALDASLDAFAQASSQGGADLVEDPTWDRLNQAHVSVRAVVDEPDRDFAEIIRQYIADCRAAPGAGDALRGLASAKENKA